MILDIKIIQKGQVYCIKYYIFKLFNILLLYAYTVHKSKVTYL